MIPYLAKGFESVPRVPFGGGRLRPDASRLRRGGAEGRDPAHGVGSGRLCCRRTPRSSLSALCESNRVGSSPPLPATNHGGGFGNPLRVPILIDRSRALARPREARGRQGGRRGPRSPAGTGPALPKPAPRVARRTALLPHPKHRHQSAPLAIVSAKAFASVTLTETLSSFEFGSAVTTTSRSSAGMA